MGEKKHWKEYSKQGWPNYGFENCLWICRGKKEVKTKAETIWQTYYSTAQTAKHLSGKGHMARLYSRAGHINLMCDTVGPNTGCGGLYCEIKETEGIHVKISIKFYKKHCVSPKNRDTV